MVICMSLGKILYSYLDLDIILHCIQHGLGILR